MGGICWGLCGLVYQNPFRRAFGGYPVQHVKINLRQPISDSYGIRASVFTIVGVTSEVPQEVSHIWLNLCVQHVIQVEEVWEIGSRV